MRPLVFLPILAALCLKPVPLAAHSDAGAFAGGHQDHHRRHHGGAGGHHDHHGRHHGGDADATPSAPTYQGVVRLDPRKVREVVIKVNAKVINLRRLQPGRPVTKGEVLMEFESAELETIQRTYIEMVANFDALQAFSVTGGEKLVEARISLQWRGLSEEGIRQIEDRRSPLKTVPVVSPVNGYLVDIAVVEGEIINAGVRSGLFSAAGTTLLRVAERDGLLIEAAVPSRAAARLAAGDPAEFWMDADRRRGFPGRVEQVLPIVNAANQTRLVRIRPDTAAAPAVLPNGTVVRVSIGNGND